MYKWDTPDNAWASAQILAHPDEWLEYEQDLEREVEDQFHVDIIINYSGSPKDLEALQSLLTYYTGIVSGINQLLLSLHERDEINRNPEAIKVVFRMQQRFQGIKQRIEGFLECMRREKQQLSEALIAMAEGQSTPGEKILINDRVLEDEAYILRSGQSVDDEKNTSSSAITMPSPRLTDADLCGKELTCKELADVVKVNESTLRRRAIEAAEQAGGWNSSSGYPLEISGIDSIDGKKYAATSRGGGGARRGWIFREIAANFKPCIDPSSSTGQ